MRPDTEMRGSYIPTFTGLKFYPLDPHDQDRYRIEDIAHALANCCRFAGHTREFYSVAQHSTLMCSMTDDITLKRWALMHDSCEAYVGDMVRPLKKFYIPWKRIERRILEQVAINERGDSLDAVIAVAGDDLVHLIVEQEHGQQGCRCVGVGSGGGVGRSAVRSSTGSDFGVVGRVCTLMVQPTAIPAAMTAKFKRCKDFMIVSKISFDSAHYRA